MAQSQYATSADLQSVAVTNATAGRFGQVAIDTALQAASSIADSYIASQFTLPLATSPQGWDASLTLAVCNIAAYLLYCQFGFNPAAPADKLIEERHNRALDWLGQIRDQKIFPQWTDSSGDATAPLEDGPYVRTDIAVGFTGCGSIAPQFDWAWGLW